MIINELEVIQVNSNCYRIYTPQQLHVMDVCMPPDGQLLMDAKTLELMTKALSLRWGIIKPQGKLK